MYLRAKTSVKEPGLRNGRKGEEPPVIGPSSTLVPRFSALFPISDFQLKLFPVLLFPSFSRGAARPARPFIFQDFPLMPEGSEKEGLERAFPSLSGHSTTKIS